MGRTESEENTILLKSLAFHIHKKEPAAEALARCFEAEGRGGKHRKWRHAVQILEAEGFVPSLVAAGLIGGEAAQLLSILETTGDHRLLSSAITALAEHREP
jgi:hypothetical protein